MTYVVELRYIGGDLAKLKRDMLDWLDRNGVEPEAFHHSSAPPGLAFRVVFGDRGHAAAFAEAFGGWIEDADAQFGSYRKLAASSDFRFVRELKKGV